MDETMNLPSFSIVIPCRNEEQYIGNCLQSIVNSDYPKHLLQVWVCDGNSTDKSADIVRQLSAQYPFIQLLINERQTTPFALNLGIKHSTTAIVMILGGHAELYPSYIKECVHVFDKDQKIGVVGGLLDNVFEDELSKAIALAMSSSFGVGSAHFRTGNASGYVDTVAFGAYKREVFDAIGLFDEALARNQDDEFNFRVIKAGFKIYLHPEARIKYIVRASFSKLFRQYQQYGYWKVLVNTKHKTVTSTRQLVPAAFVAYLILASLLSLLFPIYWGVFYAGLMLYILASVAAAKSKASNFKELMRVAYSFYLLHLSYGWGYLRGIVDFVLLRKKPSNNSLKLSR